MSTELLDPVKIQAPKEKVQLVEKPTPPRWPFYAILLIAFAFLTLWGVQAIPRFSRQAGPAHPAGPASLSRQPRLVQAGPQSLTAPERNYLEGVYRDTWKYLAAFVTEETGVPYDSSARQPATSTSNVGLYLASVATAYRTGLIAKEEAASRIERAVASLSRVETWRGFPRPWFLVRTLEPTHGEEFSYGPHTALLLGGLVVAKTTFPELAPPIFEIIQKMEFRSLYDARTQWLRGGYNLKTQNFAIFQPWGHWYYKHFASEIRLLSFYLVARGFAPLAHWRGLIRLSETRDGETYFLSGLEDGGMYVPYVAGLFLDERKTEMGASQKNYARLQMKRAKKMRAPVWGWSSCEAPEGRFLAYGELRDEIVAPYASMLASLYFPRETTANLARLEKMGARSSGFGFVDSVNWRTGTVAKDQLTSSQGMAFLALANLLYDGVVWRAFRKDAAVAKGLVMLKEEGYALSN